MLQDVYIQNQKCLEDFHQALAVLNDLEKDGLIQPSGDGLCVTGSGRLLIRNIASVFETYLQHKTEKTSSKTI